MHRLIEYFAVNSGMYKSDTGYDVDFSRPQTDVRINASSNRNSLSGQANLPEINIHADDQRSDDRALL